MKNFFHLMRIQFKLIFSSAVFWIFCLFNADFFGFFYYELKFSSISHSYNFHNYADAFNTLAYLEITIFLLAFCMAIFFVHQKNTLEQMSFIQKYKILCSKIISLFLASLIICLIPVVYVVVSAFLEHTELSFTMLAMSCFVLRWSTTILFAQSLGFLIGTLLRTPFVYLLAAPFSFLFSMANPSFLNKLPGIGRTKTAEMISTLLSLQRPFPSGVDLDYAGARVDSFFLVKIALVFTAAIFLFCIVITIVHRRFAWGSGIGMVVSFSLVVLLTMQYFSLYPKLYAYTDKLFIKNYEEQPYTVTAYSGNIQLKEHSKVNCTVDIRKAEGAAPNVLTLRLDTCFKLRSLTCEGTLVTYSREGDYLTITDVRVLDKPSATLNFTYDGRVYYLSDIHSINICTTDVFSALPPNFAFVPVLDGDRSDKTYDFTVSCKNTLISNLDVQKQQEQYTLTGSASVFCLYSGFLSETQIDGVTVYRAKYRSLDYDKFYTERLQATIFDPYSGSFTNIINLQKIKKAFLIYSNYGTNALPYQCDEFVLCDTSAY